jgi:hypothetical protein
MARGIHQSKYSRDELHDVPLRGLAAVAQQLAVAVQSVHACAGVRCVFILRDSGELMTVIAVTCVVCTSVMRFCTRTTLIRACSGHNAMECNGRDRLDVPEKSAEPTPTMMIDIGCLDASMMAA